MGTGPRGPPGQGGMGWAHPAWAQPVTSAYLCLLPHAVICPVPRLAAILCAGLLARLPSEGN